MLFRSWLLTRPGIAAPLASARNLEQFDALLPMATVSLSAAEVDELTAASD